MQPHPSRPSGPPVRARAYTSTTPLTPRPMLSQPQPTTPPVPQSTTRRRHAITPRLVSLTLIVLGVAIVGSLGLLRAHSKLVLPAAVAQQLSFGIYFPTTKTAVATIDKHTISYQAGNGLLSYTAKLIDGTTVSVNQQATPESFIDIPQAYDQLVSSLQPYSSFDSINGKVSLTHPKELQGGQSAVMNAKGTLLFARPSKSLSNDQWRQLFNGLFAQQIPAAK